MFIVVIRIEYMDAIIAMSVLYVHWNFNYKRLTFRV